MVKRTKKGKTGAKVFAAIMSVVLGLSNVPGAMSGAMAYAETGEANDAQVTEGAGEQASSVASTDGAGSEGSSVSAEGEEQKKSSGAEEKQETPGEDSSSTGSGSEDSAKGEESGDANEKSTGTGSSDKDKKSNSSDEASSEKTETVEKSDEKDAEATGKKSSEKTADAASEYSTYDPSSSSRDFDYNKTDVWDFGAEDLGENYNNRLDVDTINGFYDGVEPGSTGKTIASFSVDDGDFVFNDGGNSNTHKLRTINSALTHADEKSLKDSDGNVYSGYLYSNKSSNESVYLALECQADDIITAYVSRNNGDSEIHFVNMSDSSDDTSYTHTLGGSMVSKFVCYPSQTAKYKFYSANEKLVVARVTREHASYANLTGTVSGFTGTDSFDVVFTNTKNGNEVKATVVDGKYTAELACGFDYELSLEGADEYVITTDKTVNISDDAEMNIEVSSVDLVEVSGTVKGIAEDAVDKFIDGAEFTFKAQDENSVFVPVINLKKVGSDIKFETRLQKDVIYDVSVADKAQVAVVEDYDLLTTEFKADDAAIEFEAKPVYKVTIVPEGASKEDLAEAVFTFTRLDVEKEFVPDGYVYEFTGLNDIALRDGQYVVKVTNSGAFVQKLTSNLIVNGANVSKTINFSSDITEWDFSDAAFAAKFANATEGNYNGLSWTNGRSHNNTYLYSGAGKISVPVKGACQIQVTANYQYSYYFENDAEKSVNVLTKSTSQNDTFTFDYKGEAGTFDITVLGTSYIAKIATVYQTEYKKELLVGSSDKADFATIGEALEAVRLMNREDGERVTINIEPGNYEEMLVVDVPDVTLANASSAPTNTLTDSGVGIDANAVRITWYYGHGYSYYSMGSDYKYDAEVLAANKANGYASVANPGSGTGTYWNASVVVNASGFEAKNIIFENSFNQYQSQKAAEDVIVPNSGSKEGTVARASMAAGDTTVQEKKYVERAAALALTASAKEAYFEGCRIVGRQDTLYGAVGTTAAFYNCAVYGGTDYIFGGMTAVFAKCDLVLNTSEDKNDVAYITAAQQQSASSRGYLMYNCTVKSTTPGVDTASAHTSKPGQFGRPWQANTSEAVFFDTVVEATNWTLGADGKYTYDESSEVSLIQPEGWNTTLGGESARNVEYGTFEVAKVDNSSSRVSWVQQPKDAVLADGTAISVAAFLGEWDPFTANNDDMTITFPDGTSQDAPEAPAGESPSQSGVYTLLADDLNGFGKGDKKNGETEAAGTDKFFTLQYSEKSAVNTNYNKDWEDGFSSTNRINLGGNATTALNSIKFTTTTDNAELKVWWGSNTKPLVLLGSDGASVQIAEAGTKDALYITKYVIEKAGTYFLGSSGGTDYICKVVVTEKTEEPAKVYTFEGAGIDAFAQGAKEDGAKEETGTDKYFTLFYSSKTKVEDKEKTFEDEYHGTRRVNFGGGVKTEKNSVKFTTSSDKAKVKLWWVAGANDRQMAILDAEGKVVVSTSGTTVKDAAYISEFTLEKAGTYFLGGHENNNYIFKVEVTEGGSEEVVRANWTDVAAPVISSVALDENDSSKVVVKVKSEISTNGGDALVVTMYDEQGMEKGSSRSLKEGTEFEFTFAPTRTGKYYFTATLSRDDVEEVKTSDKSKEISFTYELKAPAFKNATNKGNGSVTVKFYSSSEADDYVLTYIDTENEKSSKSARITPKEVVYNTSTEYAYTFDGLTVGHKYNFELVAKRGQETSEVSVLQGLVVTKESGIEWTFAAFGSGVSTSSTNCGYKTNDNGSVTVWNTGNKGKIVPASTDGLSFFYATLPADKNFTFTATATIDTWAFTNGQEGFGLMACDRVGVNGDASVFWNNSYMASGTKVEYYYDKEKGESTFDETDSKITMKLGLGAQQKIGVTQENLDLLEANDTETIKNDFSSKMYPLETSCGTKGTGTYNLFGKESSGTVQGTVDNTLTKVRLRIQKNNTGYFVSYLDENDNELCTRKFYDTEALSKLDPDHVYVGFYASRTFKATFSDIEIVRTNPEDDAPAEDRDITYVAPNYKIVSATYSNTAKYDLSYSGNADGTLTISDGKGNVLVNAQEVTANETVTVTTKLARGDNKFNVKFIPSEFFFPEGDQYKRLSSYEMSEFTHTVKFETINDSDSVYVSADGKAGADGSKESPVDIYTAVKYVQPGQTIRLAAGTYSLRSTVKVERGIDGTPSKPIKMVAEDGRAIFDFNKSCAGFIFAGDYWYVNGIDCTKSGNSLKGIQVSGSHITLEDVRTYENGNTGIQVSRYLGTDDRDEWPSYDLILNCTSYSNADAGYEDADGFAAKLTVGEGVVFDGCIAYNNADDGWDLFAKVETGSIGQVTIRNCVAFANGYGVDGTNEGNGNGFKMGGSSINGPHKLINSVAWGNKAKGIDSNSGPDIQVYNSMSFNNGGNNVALYTNDTANTDYLVDGVISFRTTGEGTNENIKAKGTQDKSKIYGKKNFFWQDGKSANSEGLTVTSDWFVSLDAPYASSSDPYAVAASLRTSNGSIDLGDFMKLTDKAIEAMSAAGLSASEVAANIGGNYEAVTDERNIAGSADDAKNDEETEEENGGSGEAGSGSSTSGSTSGSSSSGSGSGSGSGSSESSDSTGSESGSSSESTSAASSAASSASSSSTTGATIPTGEVAQTGTTVTGQTNTPVVAGATRENGTSSDNGTGSSEGTQSDNGSSNEAAQADSSATQENVQQDNSAATENAAVDNGSDKTIVDEQAPKSDKPERKVPVAPIAGGTVVVVAAAAIAVKTGLMAKLLAFLHIIK